jgi:hypothetical protein
MKKILLLLCLMAGAAFGQCGPNGKLVFNAITGLLECTGKTGAAGYVSTFTGSTGFSVTAATSGQGLQPTGFCYDNASPANLITQTAGFPTVSSAGTITFAWTGSKTGYCLISALGTAVGPAGATGATGPAGANGSNGAAATIAAGTTTTLSAGSSATVTNVGTSSAAIFNFGIPQGAAGTGGASTCALGLFSGPDTTKSLTYGSSCTGTTHNILYPAVITVWDNSSPRQVITTSQAQDPSSNNVAIGFAIAQSNYYVTLVGGTASACTGASWATLTTGAWTALTSPAWSGLCN